MPLYMAQFAYTVDAWAAFTKNPENRTAALQNLAKKVGAKVEQDRGLRRGRIRLFLAGKLTALKPGTVRLIYAVLRLMLGSAVDEGILQANPADGLGKTFRFHKKAAAQHEEIKAMTRQQLAHFLQTAERVAVEYWVFFFLLARTGMRLGEAPSPAVGGSRFRGPHDPCPTRVFQ